MNKKNSPQRKTTLKWNSNGELSEVDMLRILEKISSSKLNQCELTCDFDQVQTLIQEFFLINKLLNKQINLTQYLNKIFSYYFYEKNFYQAKFFLHNKYR